MTLIIRNLTASDETFWRELWAGYCEFYGKDVPDAVTEATWQGLIDSNEPLFSLVACEKDDQPIGFVTCVLHSMTLSQGLSCYLEVLYTSPKARGRGAARALIEALRERGVSEKWERIYLMTAADNEKARGLYDKVADLTPWVRYDVPLGAPE